MKLSCKFLYEKYSSSQNYYYIKQINDIIEDNRKKIAIVFKDQRTFDEEDQNLFKRYYSMEEIEGKNELLVEYYRYHNDVPRLFMDKLSDLMHEYFDKKRRINYIKITKML